MMMTTNSQVTNLTSTLDFEVDYFTGKYSIYCHDPLESEPVNLELVQQLADELKARNPKLVRNSKGNIYLTADSFDTIQDLITQKEEAEDFLAEGYEAYLLDISSPLFYFGYPKLFWTDYQFDDRIDSKDEWGQVSFQRPLN